MALENYLEMRERVVDPEISTPAGLAWNSNDFFPQRFIPRYSMVMFHHEISYQTAQLRGAVQTQLLADLTANAATLADIDFDRAGDPRANHAARLPRSQLGRPYDLSSVTKAIVEVVLVVRLA